MACLQMCLQYTTARTIHIPQSRGSVLLKSKHCSRQKLHKNFAKSPWMRSKQDESHDKGSEKKAARYLSTVCANTEMPLCICEASRRSANIVSQTQAKELGRVSVVRPITFR